MSAVLVPSVAQAVAVQEWALRALNTNDLGAAIVPAPFADQNVFIGNRDHPRALRFARISTISLIGQGPAQRSHEVVDPGGPGEDLLHRAHSMKEWTVSFSVVVRQSSVAPSLADSAGIYMEQALDHFEGPLSTVQAQQGIEPLRITDETDASRVAGSANWETRAVTTLVFACGRTSSISVNWVEQATGTGQIDALTPLPFDSNLSAP